jgi:hypothetical protein
MAMDDSMLVPFHNDLNRSSHLLRLVKEFREFAALPIPPDISNGSISWPLAEELHSAASLVRTDLPILAGSIHLYVCGRFEYFVRELVTAVGDEIAANSADYTSLPAVVRTELWQRTLDVAQNPQRYGHTTSTAEQLLVTLSQSFQPAVAGTPVQISSPVLAVTESNMHSRMLTEVFRRVNISSVWPEIGKQAAMKLYLSKSVDGECTQAAQGKLDQMMKDRNGIAHPTSATTFPDPDQVLNAIEYLRVLSQVLVDLSKIPRTSS